MKLKHQPTNHTIMDNTINSIIDAIDNEQWDAEEHLCNQVVELVCSKGKDIRQEYYKETLWGFVLYCYKCRQAVNPQCGVGQSVANDKARNKMMQAQTALASIVGSLANKGVYITDEVFKWFEDKTPDYLLNVLWMGVKDATIGKGGIRGKMYAQASMPEKQGKAGRPKATLDNYIKHKECKGSTINQMSQWLQGKTKAEAAKVWARAVVDGLLIPDEKTGRVPFSVADAFKPLECKYQNYNRAFDDYLRLKGRK